MTPFEWLVESCSCGSPDLVEELVHRLGDPLVPLDLRYRQVRIGDIPAFRGDLMLGEVILGSWTADTGPAVPGRIDDVQVVGNFLDEVVDIGVPVAVKGRGEEEPGIVVEEHEAHGVERADLIRALREVASQDPQERTQALRTTRGERDDDRQLRDLAQTGANPPGALDRRRWIRRLGPERRNRVLEGLLPELGRIGEQISELLELFLE